MQHDLPSPLTSPTLRDDLPRYPVLTQLILIESIGSTVAGPSGPLYNAVVQQLDTNLLVPRSREACLVADVVGLGLIATYYPGRLAGSFNDLPVYEVVSPALPVGTGTICLPPAFFETTLSWEPAGDYIYCLREYHRNVYILTNPTTKCLVLVPGSLYLYKTLFCLGGPNNITTIICDTCFTNPMVSGPCSACFYPSGTGSTGVGSGTCVPGQCTYCIDVGGPPYSWTLFPQGFTGVCAFFNNQWILTQRLGCSWCATATFLGGSVQVKVCLYITGPGAATLVFTVTQGGIVTSSTYYATFNNGFCCAGPLNFVPGPGILDCQCANLTNSICLLCPQAPTLFFFSLGGAGLGTGAFAIFNNNYVLDTQAGCVWTASSPPAGQTATLTIGAGIPAGVSYTLVLTGPNGVMETFSGTFSGFATDVSCCVSKTLMLSDLSIGTTGNPGNPAGTVDNRSCQINPSCDDVVTTPPCPPVITVGPQCCSGVGSGIGSGTCVPAICSFCTDPQGAPYGWRIVAVGFLSCPAFNMSLIAYGSTCDWVGTANTDLGVVKGEVIVTATTITVKLYLNGTLEFTATKTFGGNCCIAYAFGPTDVTLNLCTTRAGFGVEIGPLCCPAGTGTGGGLITGCCPTVTMPSVLHLNFLDTTGDCACVAALNPIPLTWDGSMWTWSGDLCGKPTDIRFYCNFGGSSCNDFIFNASTFGSGIPSSCTCGPPFNVQYGLTFGEENPCTGTATAVITF